MKKKKVLSLTITGIMALSTMMGCGENTAVSEQKKEKEADFEESKDNDGHEPLTIVDSGQDYTELIDLVHEKYLEIRLEIEGYIGQNQSRYFYKQLETGDMPDIYTTTYAWDGELQREHLIDLSGEEFSSNYNEVNLDACSVDGENYLLPGDYFIRGIAYNKTLFEKKGWSVPRNFGELEALIPRIKAAGVEPCITMLGLPGFAFQYFCNVSDTIFLATTDGIKWQKNFQDGSASAVEGLAESAERFQQWIDCGMLNDDNADLGIIECQEKFYEGNTAFMIGNIERWTQNEDGSGDQYGMIPYLSDDGTQNMYITSVRRYYGLNKHLEDEGNEQKLEDALHFMEVLSTPEGEKALAGNQGSLISSLKEGTDELESPYKEAVEEIQMGHGAPLTYVGWEAVIAEGGNATADWICGKKTGLEVLEIFDKLQTDYLKNGLPSYGTAEETLDTEQCAKLTGIIFGEACDADVALISVNEWKKDVGAAWENFYGANGKLFAGKITEDDLVVFMPTGWYDTICKAELTGREIKDIYEQGYSLYWDDVTYPYVLTVKGGKELEDDKMYTMVFCGAPPALKDTDRIEDTGISGLEAAKTYLQKEGKISADTLEWK